MAISTKRRRLDGKRTPWGARAILAATCLFALVALGAWASATPAALGGVVSRPASHPRPVTATAAPVQPEMFIPPGRVQVRVPILEYHYIRVNPDPSDRLGYNLSVTPSDFERQMDWLAANGYHPVTLEQVRAYFEQNRPLPDKPVVLSFDDGYLDFYTVAWPVLQAHHFKAVAYIVPGFLNRPAYMNPEQVQQLDRSGSVEIGSHTMTHANVAAETASELAFQVGQSKSALETLLGHPVVDFCYPSGGFSDSAIAALKSYGYDSATTELPGTAHSLSDRFTWTRERVWGGEPLSQFIAYLGAPETGVPEATPAAPPAGPAQS